MRPIPSLDGIRAASFAIVFLSHLTIHTIPGDFGVTVFFFLSGFLITTLLRVEYERTGRVNLPAFWLRRALRILPPFYLVWAALVIAAPRLYSPEVLDWPSIRAQLLFYANYWGIYGVNREMPGTGVVWSLAVEEHFYLLFPWLFLGLRMLKLPPARQALVLFSLCGLVLLWRCVLITAFAVQGDRIYSATDTRFDSLLFGCALAVWRNPALDPPLASVAEWRRLWIPLALTLLILSNLWRDSLLWSSFCFSIQGLALMLAFSAAIRFPQWLLFRPLNAGLVRAIGVLSYTLYLVHVIILKALLRLWPDASGLKRAAAALMLSIAAAALMYLAVERPCAALRRRLAPA